MKPSQLFEGKNSSLYKTFMNQTKNRIREEWENKLRNKWETFSVVNDYYENADIRLNSNKIADFFIPEINELLKSQREELVEKIEKHQNFITMSDYDVGYNDCKENIINLIKNN